MLWVWGAAGAFVYAANRLILDLWNAKARKDRLRAWSEFGVAMVTGAVFAQGFGELFRAVVASGVTINGMNMRADLPLVPSGLTVGWASNYLWPRVLKRLGQIVEQNRGQA